MIRVEWWKKCSTTRDAVTRLDFERIHWCREKEEKNLINFERIDTFTPTSFDVYHAEYNKFPFYIISDFVSKENFGNVFIIWFIVRLIWKYFWGIFMNVKRISGHINFPFLFWVENENDNFRFCIFYME